MSDRAIDSVQARNNTKVYIQINGSRVGRVQSIREDINNNVQVMAELGRAFMVELKKGITNYTFSISKFFCRNDVLGPLKLGEPFELAIRDAGPVAEDGLSGGIETLELFKHCAITSISRDYTVGQASVVENCQVVTIGKGIAI